MSNLGKILFFLFFFTKLYSEQNLFLISQEAEALKNAHDEAGAAAIYEELLSLQLPPWQQVRIFYNLGTLKLSQQRTLEAFAFFQKISPQDLSLRRFGRDFFLNQGIAYLQSAEIFFSSNSRSSLDEQAIFIKQGLQAFHTAQELHCQIQQAEQTTATTCQEDDLINQWIAQARVELQIIGQKKREEWMGQASVESLASFLSMQLQSLLHEAKNSQHQEKSFILSLKHQIESLIPIWNILQEKNFSSLQKASFDQAAAFYLKALQYFDHQDVSSAFQALHQGVEALSALTFQKNIPFHEAYLSYEILLLKDRVNASDLQTLKMQFDALKVGVDQTELLKRIQENLQISLKELQANHPLQARFFLLAGFHDAHFLVNDDKRTSPAILQQVLIQAHLNLQGLLLFSIIHEEASQKTKMQAILKNQQQEMLEEAAFFIPVVLEEQRLHFQENRDPSSSCQQSPWDQVIPLFDHGYQLARMAKKELSASSLNIQKVEIEQEQTIQDWERALNLLLHPPQNHDKSSSISQNLTNTFQIIQEMYLEDQSSPEQTAKELHTW